MPRVRILSVGQCGYDHGQIGRALGGSLDAEVVAAATHDEAHRQLKAGAFDLVLVNRVGDRDGAAGLDLIKDLKADPSTASLPAMLVSDYAEAQAEAVGVGALPGFGKSDLSHGKALAAVRSAIVPA
jgi:two-component system, chemotaxis family, chemotaxis protein CheY